VRFRRWRSAARVDGLNKSSWHISVGSRGKTCQTARRILDSFGFIIHLVHWLPGMRPCCGSASRSLIIASPRLRDSSSARQPAIRAGSAMRRAIFAERLLRDFQAGMAITRVGHQECHTSAAGGSILGVPSTGAKLARNVT
jgi:hypothetical protein